MITKLTNRIFGGKRELSSFRFIGEAVAMKNIFRNKTTQIFLAVLIVFTLQIQIFTQSAFARGSGGGDLAEFKTDKFIASVGIGLASAVIGNVVSSGISAQLGGASWGGGVGANGTTYAGMNGAMSSYGSAGTWMASYNSMAALSQLGSGISMMGQQQGWKGSTTVLVSSVAQGAVGGLLNPSSTLGLSSKSADGQIRANNESNMNSFDLTKSTDADGKLITRWSEGDLVELNKFKSGTFNTVMKVGSSRPDFSTFATSMPKEVLGKISVDTVTNTLENGVKAAGWQNAMMTSAPNFTAANCFKAIGVGALSGATEGAILASNLDNNGRIKPWVSGAAGLAGTFVGAAASSMIADVVPGVGTDMSVKDYAENDNLMDNVMGVDNRPVKGWTVDSATDEWTGPKTMAQFKADSLSQVIIHGGVKTFSAIPSRLVSMGVSNVTSDMDRQDAFMTRQAFRGVYPVVGTVYTNEIRNPILEEIRLGQYTGYNGTGGNDLQQIDRAEPYEAPQGGIPTSGYREPIKVYVDPNID